MKRNRFSVTVCDVNVHESKFRKLTWRLSSATETPEFASGAAEDGAGRDPFKGTLAALFGPRIPDNLVLEQGAYLAALRAESG